MKAISFPFTLNPFGNVNSTTTQTKIYQDRVLTLLSTVVGERPMRPTYGTDVAGQLFENQDDTIKAVEGAITSAVRIWIPEIKIEKITASSLDDAGRVHVSVSVTLPDFTSTTVSTYTSVINQNGSITG